MRNITLFILTSLWGFTLSAQEVISTQGESYTNANGSIEYTIGEVVINTETSGSIVLTQGFHQTNWNFLGVEDFAPDYDVVIFPNPTSDVLNLRTSAYENVIYTLYDAKGKLVAKDILTSEETAIQVGGFAPGSYSLTLNNGTQNLKIFKLIKQQ